jgi:protein phosphatase 1 regulatory subunit 7
VYQRGRDPETDGTVLTILRTTKEIENLDGCTLMQELWLGKNKIRKLEVRMNLVVVYLRKSRFLTPGTVLQGLDNFVKLKILSMQSNRITKLEGLDKLISLEELYLSHNGLTKIEGLEKNVRQCQYFL